MANFLNMLETTERRINDYIARLYKIKRHLALGDRRAAQRRLVGMAEELERFLQELEMPLEFMLVGSQIGFFAGRGSWIRGRLPGAVVGVLGGWLYGQAVLERHRRDVLELLLAVVEIEERLEADRLAAKAASSA